MPGLSKGLEEASQGGIVDIFETCLGMGRFCVGLGEKWCEDEDVGVGGCTELSVSARNAGEVSERDECCC